MPIHHSSPDAVARFDEMLRLASESALVERRFNDYKLSAEIARANALERETELEVSLAQMAEEKAVEELVVRAEYELKLHEMAAASKMACTLLR